MPRSSMAVLQRTYRLGSSINLLLKPTATVNVRAGECRFGQTRSNYHTATYISAAVEEHKYSRSSSMWLRIQLRVYSTTTSTTLKLDASRERTKRAHSSPNGRLGPLQFPSPVHLERIRASARGAPPARRGRSTTARPPPRWSCPRHRQASARRRQQEVVEHGAASWLLAKKIGR
jgi:hypothetical protein